MGSSPTLVTTFFFFPFHPPPSPFRPIRNPLSHFPIPANDGILLRHAHSVLLARRSYINTDNNTTCKQVRKQARRQQTGTDATLIHTRSRSTRPHEQLNKQTKQMADLSQAHDQNAPSNQNSLKFQIIIPADNLLDPSTKNNSLKSPHLTHLVNQSINQSQPHLTMRRIERGRKEKQNPIHSRISLTD